LFMNKQPPFDSSLIIDVVLLGTPTNTACKFP
jgi:hypothetical protein